MDTIGARLKYARTELRKLNQKKSMTQKKLAELSGTAQQTIGHIESDTITRPKKVIEIAGVLGVPVDWLINGGVTPIKIDNDNNEPQLENDIKLVSKFDRKSQRSIGVLAVASENVKDSRLSQGGAFGVVDWPPTFSNASGVYAVYVSGDSMAPAFRHKDIAIVSDALLYGEGDLVVVHMRGDNHTNEHVTLLEYMGSKSSDYHEFRQLSPLKVLNISTSKIVSIHKVLSHREIADL